MNTPINPMNRQTQKVFFHDILPYAMEKSAFYRRHLSSCSEESDFLHLPFTDAQDLSLHAPSMLCRSLGKIERIRSFFTSGSTSFPKRVFFDLEDLERTVRFFASGMESIAPRERPVLILFSDERPGSIADLLKTALSEIGREAVIAGRPRSLDSLKGRIGEAGCIVAMPADAYYLCRKLPHLRPDSVLLSADYLPSPIRTGIERIWNTKVFEHYGLSESCYGLAVQCSHRRSMHIRNRDFYLEIIDPETLLPLPFGKRGEIVISSLQKSALPFIRYRTGDLGELCLEYCGCGCFLPSLRKVYGRIENLRQSVNIHLLDEILFSEPGLLSYLAALSEERLFLYVEGEKIAENSLQKRIGFPLQILYEECPPWKEPGKRKLLRIHSS